MVSTRKRSLGQANGKPDSAQEAQAGRANKRQRPASSAAASASTAARTRQSAAPKPAPAKKHTKPAAKPAAKKEAKSASKPSAAGAAAAAAGGDTVTINRAPVLTLWAAVVAQRQGLSWEEALTFGRYISGMLAQSKGRSLGIFEEHEKTEEELEERRVRDAELGVERVEVFGMPCPAAPVGGKCLAVSGGKPLEPRATETYLKRSFGGQLDDAKAAMEALAGAIPAGQIGRVCYKLYEHFRPAWGGWGVKGALSLSAIRGLAKTWRQQA